jgi:hypothetical protein
LDPNNPKSRAFPILLIVPITTQVTIAPRKITLPDGREVDAVKTIIDSTSLQDIIFEAQRERRVIVFSIYLYEDEVKGQLKFAKFIKAFPKVVRDHMPRTMKFAIGMRELSDLSSNRMLTFAGSGERESKRGLNYFSRIARHSRCVLVMDMQDPDQVYSALTAQEDFILVKRMNRHHIPQKLAWLQEEIKSQLDHARQHYLKDRLGVVSMDRLANNSFYCVWPNGNYSLEHNSEPDFKHHKSDDDALELAGVKLRFLQKSELVGTEEAKIEEIKKKREAEELKDKALTDAIHYHDEDGLTWEECAVKVGWLVSGRPSGNALKMAVKRYRDRQQQSAQDDHAG